MLTLQFLRYYFYVKNKSRASGRYGNPIFIIMLPHEC